MEIHFERDTLHRILEDQQLVHILDGFRGQAAADFESDVAELGAEVRKPVNARLVDDLGNPLDASDRVIGYVALLYEAKNNQTIEEAIDTRVTTSEE